MRTAISFFSGIVLVLIICSWTQKVKEKHFHKGEEYDYRVKYGILTIGAANVGVDSKIFNVNGLPCYKVSVLGRTAGLTDLFKVRNSYISYMDTLQHFPQKFDFSARENKYKKDQVLFFDNLKNVVVRQENNTTNTYKVPDNVHDLISGYYSLRNVDFSKYSVGQTYSTNLFFDDELYNFKVRYAGKTTLKTRFGKIQALKLNPILPDNKMFKGEDAIRVWVSDDKNRVPLQIEVDFSFGTVVMDIKKYKGNMYPFSFQ